ncbi:MAG TPA: acetyl/propionyl/methylcrotonyl-CoA carboxylase subunit alpha [Alphaproteobacteria bacterium]|nr:acetyl/propionyl/methylcrotonyl-CoA carboxylase subunit alpha [Alphaproteobacteria bacterium]
MFSKILIANRGEIACRIARTARRLGIRTVAVHSEADASARHVRLADEAVAIGPAPAKASYLNGRAIVAAAQLTGCEAIHPGYGFLSENAGFAEACTRAGLVFVGPPAAAIRSMGSKSEAKRLMERAGVPIVAGYHGEAQDEATLAAEAARIGYPVLVKASAGGGGKGMRVATGPSELGAALASARREAESAFGDGKLLLEKYLERPRHIEIQIFCDRHGNAVHLFERDCSIQRRHQKVIEEAPAPGLDSAQRARMGEAALTAARAIGYEGAGTVEFIVAADGTFHFMEMNTRLQVEHPVTEMITGQDLVEWQLRVAAGETLPLAQDRLAISGHAFEARLYAEDPARDFLPATGTLAHLQFPAEGRHLRIDTGVEEGDKVSVHYDPMLAKLIVWDETREAARQRLVDALGACEIAGVATNLAFLGAVAAHPAFAAAEIDTGFIERHRADLLPDARPAPDRIAALACLALVLERARAAQSALWRAGERQTDGTFAGSADPRSPWAFGDGFRLNQDGRHAVHLQDGTRRIDAVVRARPGHYVVELPGGALEVARAFAGERTIEAEIAGTRTVARAVRTEREIAIFAEGKSHRFAILDPLAVAAEAEAEGGSLRAPMPGKVVDVLVAEGARVARGTPLLILEAMKMEHTIRAPADGTVEKVKFAPGSQVEEGAELIAFRVEGETAPEEIGP